MNRLPRNARTFTMILCAGVAGLLVSTAIAEIARAQEPELGEKLIRAVQEDDLVAVRRLLETGVDVNSTSRYGATPLFFACGAGNLELVELLLDKGADVNVSDSFYKATPLRFTIFGIEESEDHVKIAHLLLEHGAEDASSALEAAIRIGNLGLATAAVETGRVPAPKMRSALDLANASDRAEIASFLRARAHSEEKIEHFPVSADRLQSYVGKYTKDGLVFEILPTHDDQIMVRVEGEQPVLLDATAEDVFVPRGVSGQQLTFRGRAGIVEGAVVRNGTEDQYFRRTEAQQSPSIPEVKAQLAPFPELPEVARVAAINWPRFRGSNASGVGDGQGVHPRWDGESGVGVMWKTAIAGIAHSSPVIWGDLIFVTSAESDDGDQSLRTGLYGDVDMVEDDSEYAWKVYALAKKSGEIVWQRTASRGRPKLERHLKSTHANPTPVTDGERVVVSFASEGLYCYRLDGELLWSNELGLLASGWFYNESYEWGFSSSPIIYRDYVIVQIDIQRGSYIAAFDLASGELVWKTDRDEIPTWGTPVVLPGEGSPPVDEIVTNGTTIRGYDAMTGYELWTLEPNSEVTVASPVISEGMAFVTGGYPPARPIYALGPGGRGDLSLGEDETSSKYVRWSRQRGGTYIPTPIIYRDLLYVLQNNGRLTTYEAKTGELVYKQRVGKGHGFSASPIAADGRLFFTNEEGSTFVVRAGRDFELLATNELSEIVMSSPAISDGLIVIRGANNVWALGERSAR